MYKTVLYFFSFVVLSLTLAIRVEARQTLSCQGHSVTATASHLSIDGASMPRSHFPSGQPLWVHGHCAVYRQPAGPYWARCALIDANGDSFYNVYSFSGFSRKTGYQIYEAWECD